MLKLKTLQQKFDLMVSHVSLTHNTKRAEKRYLKLQKACNLPTYHITRHQKKEATALWNGLIKKRGFSTYQLVSTARGEFDPRICCKQVFNDHLLFALNDQKAVHGLRDKNYFDLFMAGAPMPKTIARNMHGNLMDANYEPINSEKLNELLSDYDKVLVKPSIDSGYGNAIKIYEKKFFDQILKDFEKDFLIQEVLVQHSTLASLNSSSVNIIRVISLNLNGKVTPINHYLRCGAEGSIVDNHITKDGRGMYIIAVNKDGTLSDKAYYACGESINQAPNGTDFSQLKLPNFDKVLELTTRIHRRFPQFGFVGYDITIDQQGMPVIIELNFKLPEGIYNQYTIGPLFGDRTQEVIDTLCHK